MIDIEALNSALIIKNKMTWGLTSNLLNHKHQHALRESYPTQGFSRYNRDNGPKKHYSFSLQHLVLNNQIDESARANVNNIWADFANELLSQSYHDVLSSRLNIDLNNAIINIGFYKFDIGDWVAPHIDNEDKILTQIFYFNNFWDTEWGGYLKILNSQSAEDEYFSVPPLITFSTLISRCNNAWHMVTPINPNAQECRLSMQLEFIKR